MNADRFKYKEITDIILRSFYEAYKVGVSGFFCKNRRLTCPINWFISNNSPPDAEFAKFRHMIKIKDEILIGEDELYFTFSRSSKPGGQNVNKISSRVTLLLDVANSPSFSAEHKNQIMTLLRTRVNKEGVLRIVSQRHRSQAANREAAIERLVELLQETLKPIKSRRKTRILLAAKKRRLNGKKRQSRLKQERAKPTVWDE